MPTVETLATAKSAVQEGGVYAVYAYNNEHGATVFKVCLSEADETALLNSGSVKLHTVILVYDKNGWVQHALDELEGENTLNYGDDDIADLSDGTPVLVTRRRY